MFYNNHEKTPTRNSGNQHFNDARMERFLLNLKELAKIKRKVYSTRYTRIFLC